MVFVYTHTLYADVHSNDKIKFLTQLSFQWFLTLPLFLNDAFFFNFVEIVSAFYFPQLGAIPVQVYKQVSKLPLRIFCAD